MFNLLEIGYRAIPGQPHAVRQSRFAPPMRCALLLLGRLKTQPEYFEPDPYVTEAPFLTVGWPNT